MTTPGDPDVEAIAALAVRQSVHVDLPPSEAFRLFTDGIGEWWPLEEGYSYGGDRARGIFLEPVDGGRFFERFVDGNRRVGAAIGVQHRVQALVCRCRSSPAAQVMRIRSTATSTSEVVGFAYAKPQLR